ncbi:MAG TPA: amino acid ABC transporter substrate-binding protein [Arthrobacter bacterium]|jgi:polar amino acid transport system substrate-binding protein|nr:amino acid ABC transporter substrate-binding protein [Arthrobacter sp.]HAP90819.1 amino acid ABC transporter substrate-binding protein [Arthrobacter sp.]HBH59692.1 amino acid ABC transporter substrate-binding protein [Arthrobacter sp.]HCB58431.1 amino acid ABC transporter substrate-binding protein [Arthrobacter sp.]HCC40923.1 amino acid ABC transporter substrate-binding protein [Arthrobacter sp.]
MKINALKWLTAAPVALALAVSLAACGSGSAQPSGTSTDALAGSDQQALDKYTTADVTPLDKIDKTKLGLNTEGKLEVGTLSDAPPNIFIDPAGKFTGYDNELLRAIAGKLGLDVEFVATDFSALLSQVQTKQFDLGSSSISTTDARRANVGFTNGYDFGFMAVVAKTNSDVKGFKDLNANVRIGVVQGTVQDDYVTNTLKLEPVRFPDYATVYANVRNGQIDAWVAPSQQATGQVKEGDGTVIAESVVNTQNFTAYAVNKDNKALIDALNSGLDAVIADGTWAKLTKEWYPDRTTPADWKPGSKAAPAPKS